MVLGAGSLCKQADHREPTILELVVYHVEIIEEFFFHFRSRPGEYGISGRQCGQISMHIATPQKSNADAVKILVADCWQVKRAELGDV